MYIKREKRDKFLIIIGDFLGVPRLFQLSG